jgi:(R,R)-butanediol dehydrogenase/meso-butanediol dehydrogenase/diacetyl reductase
MLAAVFHGAHDIRLEDIPEPSPKADEVLVRVLQAGICGSDLNRFHYGSHPWPPGFIMGHEFCGEIAAVGSDATAWQVGQRVVVEPTIYCGSCFYCQQGYYNRCIDFVTRGITGSGTNGGFAEYVCVPAYQPHRQPPTLSPALGALVEPTAVSVHGWQLAGIAQPDSVVVVGIGNIGLLAVLVAKTKGAKQIIAVGKYAPRQELAQRYGASLVLSPDDPKLQEHLLAHTDGLGAELVLEAAGTPSSLRMAVESARKGGKIVVLGVFHEEVSLDYRHILMTEKQLMGSIIYRRQDFADAIAILGTGSVDMTHHITSEVSLRDIVTRGFLPLSANKAEHIKIHVMPQV